MLSNNQCTLDRNRGATLTSPRRVAGACQSSLHRPRRSREPISTPSVGDWLANTGVTRPSTPIMTNYVDATYSGKPALAQLRRIWVSGLIAAGGNGNGFGGRCTWLTRGHLQGVGEDSKRRDVDLLTPRLSQ
jgi:hypothetical protein